MESAEIGERTKCPCCGSKNVQTTVVDNETRLVRLRDRVYPFHPDGRIPPGRWRMVACRDCGEVSRERVTGRS